MYCIIMAGGSGTRFWPRSRQNQSKQFLKILGNESLILSTVKRFQKFISHENVFIVARKDQETQLKQHIPDVAEENFLFEPVGKNTAPCIGLAALFVQKKDPDGIMIVSPADHLIKDEKSFRKTMKVAGQLAEEQGGLVTIGIKPNHPATGYGYIQVDGKINTHYDIETFKVKTFAEKPNLATAKRFLDSGDFYWNSGIFVFKASVYLKALEEFLPNLHDALMEIDKFIDKPDYEKVLSRVYQQIKKISIDYGVMEKAKNVFIVKGDFSWNDLGSWEQVYKLSAMDQHGNSVSGTAVLLDTQNSYIYSSEGIIAVLGLADIVVVREGDAVLVCRRDMAEDVNLIVDRIRRQKLEKYI